MEETAALVTICRGSQEKDRPTKGCCSIPCRYTLAILSCMGFCVVYLLRVNLSVALVAMVNSSYADANADSHNPDCDRNVSKSALDEGGEFNWDQKTQGLILGSFFYGYIITQIPGGYLAARFGAKHLFGCGILCTAILTLFTPLAARHSVTTLIVLRVLEGLGEGVTFPAMHAMWSRWAPPMERSKLVALSYSGLQLGTILGMPLSGLLSASSIAGGWPSVFYFFGGVGVLWFLVWTAVVYDTPCSHPRISEEEKYYIISSIGPDQDKKKRASPIPWLSIWTSPALWAIVIAHTCNNWGFYTFLTCLPSYFKEVLNFSISENGLVSALPFACQYLFTIIGGQLADYLRHNGIATTIDVRRTLTCGGSLIPACLLVATSYVGCHDTFLAVGLFTLALGFSGLSMSGYNVNHLDISPRYAGILLGITNCAATIPGIVGPYVVGFLTNNEPTQAQWQKVFYISAAAYVVGALAYTCLSSADVQPWNAPFEDQLIPINFSRAPRKSLLSNEPSSNVPAHAQRALSTD